jgi:hypothetical protein
VIFATVNQSLQIVTVPNGFSRLMSPGCNIGLGGHMSIDTLLLVLLVAFGVGFVLNRIEFGRKSRRFG